MRGKSGVGNGRWQCSLRRIWALYARVTRTLSTLYRLHQQESLSLFSLFSQWPYNIQREKQREEKKVWIIHTQVSLLFQLVEEEEEEFYSKQQTIASPLFFFSFLSRCGFQNVFGPFVPFREWTASGTITTPSFRFTLERKKDNKNREKQKLKTKERKKRTKKKREDDTPRYPQSDEYSKGWRLPASKQLGIIELLYIYFSPSKKKKKRKTIQHG